MGPARSPPGPSFLCLLSPPPFPPRSFLCSQSCPRKAGIILYGRCGGAWGLFQRHRIPEWRRPASDTCVSETVLSMQPRKCPQAHIPGQSHLSSRASWRGGGRRVRLVHPWSVSHKPGRSWRAGLRLFPCLFVCLFFLSHSSC